MSAPVAWRKSAQDVAGAWLELHEMKGEVIAAWVMSMSTDARDIRKQEGLGTFTRSRARRGSVSLNTGV